MTTALTAQQRNLFHIKLMLRTQDSSSRFR